MRFLKGVALPAAYITQTLYIPNKILLPLYGTNTYHYENEIQKFRWAYGQRRQAH